MVSVSCDQNKVEKKLLMVIATCTQGFFIDSGHLMYCICHIIHIACCHTCHAASITMELKGRILSSAVIIIELTKKEMKMTT